MSFLSPIWFIALAALGIPVLIHLWNIRPGKTLKVGSISLITEASKTTSRSFKLLEILLLILRCLLLALLAFFLAGPLWAWFAPEKKAKGWVLIPKENLKESYQKFKPQVDSLLKAGFEFHYFNKGFTTADLKPVLADTTLKDTVTQANYWRLVKQLDEKARGVPQIYLYTPNGLCHFTGSKPVIKSRINWSTYTQADSTSRWIAGAWLNNSGEVKVLLGNSNPLGTQFSEMQVEAGGDGDLQLTVQNGRPLVSLKGAKQQAIAVDTSRISVAIYTDKYALDAHYLQAALKAATAFMGRKAVVKQYASPNQIPAGQTWLFWLSDMPVDGRLATNCKNVFQYEGDKTLDVHTVINLGDIALTKRTTHMDEGTVLWQDGFGWALLRREQADRTNTYHFYTHFNPAWNDLVWNDAFPKQILQLLNDKPYALPAENEKRVLSHQQLMPYYIINSYTPSSITATDPKDISPYFWLLIVFVFAAERWLSHRIKSTTNG
ncbi:BatA domain-containing protein [Mucilaginibacter psychrotolerans]|nr:BatA domain-containing protein [Mucilaginibacter psychrotolerans]